MLIPRATARLDACWIRLGSVTSCASVSGTSLICWPPTVAGRMFSRLASIGTAGEAAGEAAPDGRLDGLAIGPPIAMLALAGAVGARVGCGDPAAGDELAAQPATRTKT